MKDRTDKTFKGIYVKLESEDHRALRIAAAKADVTITEYVRNALKKALKGGGG